MTGCRCDRIFAAVDALRLGIVGTGRHGSRYAKHAARDVDGLELVAVCRRDEAAGSALARELDCDYTADADALIDRDDIDAVALVTVPDLLPDWVERAARAGKRLLVEKPVARDLADGRRMAAVLAETGTYCLAGHTLRFNAVVELLAREVSSLGRLDSLVLSQRFPPQLELDWLDRPERSGGGSIRHTGVHCFDLVRTLAGRDIVSVCCQTNSVYTHDTEDNFAAQLELDGGVLALVTCSRSTKARNGLVEISGEEGILVGDHVLGTAFRVDANGRTELDPGPARMTVKVALERMVEDWRSGSPPPVDFDDGLRAVAVADACYAAARTGARANVETP